MLNRLLFSLPPLVLLVDLVYGFVLNVSKGLNLQSGSGDALTPDIAFNGLQIAANGGMVLLVGFGLIVLLQMTAASAGGRRYAVGVFRLSGLLVLAAFSLPSLPEWFHALSAWVDGGEVFNTGNLRYLAVAFCMPLTALLLLWQLFCWYRYNAGNEKTDED